MSEHGRLAPTKAEQDAYYYLRSCLTAAIAKNLEAIRKVAPAVGEAVERLEAFKAQHDRKDFRIFRPEDSQSTDDARDKLFLR